MELGNVAVSAGLKGIARVSKAVALPEQDLEGALHRGISCHNTSSHTEELTQQHDAPIIHALTVFKD